MGGVDPREIDRSQYGTFYFEKFPDVLFSRLLSGLSCVHSGGFSTCKWRKVKEDTRVCLSWDHLLVDELSLRTSAVGETENRGPGWGG